MSRPRSIPIVLLFLFLCGLARAATAADVHAAPRDVDVADRTQLDAALRGASPGDRIRLAAGEYRGGISLRDLDGTAEHPIEITSRDPDAPARIVGGTSGLQLSDVRHLVLRGLVVEGASGNGINIDDGGSFETPSSNVLLDRVVVRNIGPRGNRDGIKLSGVVDFRIVHSTVERWGDGGSGIDMVGCHRGLISECTFLHDGPSGANGVQMKGGSREVTIRRCRFENAGGRAVNLGGSTGLEYFRPRPEGFEARDLVVEDSLIIGSDAAIAFVGVDGAIVRHNTIRSPRRWVMRILQETRRDDFAPCRRGRFESNIVVYHARDVRSIVNVGPDTAPESFVFARNAWYATDDPQRSREVLRALPSRETDGIYGRKPELGDPASGDHGQSEANRKALGGAGPRPSSPETPDAKTVDAESVDAGKRSGS